MNLHQRRLDGEPAGDGTGRRQASSSGASRDLLSAMTDAARENPVSAALIGLGALWLFMGGNNTSLLGGHGRKSLLGGVAQGAGSVAQGAAGAAGSAASAVSSGMSGLTETVSTAAERVSEYVGDKLHGVDAEAAYRNPSFGNDADVAENWEPSGYPSSLSLMRQNLRDLFERHPVALGIAGLALGAGVAASFPVTTAERDTLGEAGKAVRNRLSAAADQAKELAGAVADEIRQQGTGSAGTP